MKWKPTNQPTNKQKRDKDKKFYRELEICANRDQLDEYLNDLRLKLRCCRRMISLQPASLLSDDKSQQQQQQQRICSTCQCCDLCTINYFTPLSPPHEQTATGTGNGSGLNGNIKHFFKKNVSVVTTQCFVFVFCCYCAEAEERRGRPLINKYLKQPVPAAPLFQTSTASSSSAAASSIRGGKRQPHSDTASAAFKRPSSSKVAATPVKTRLCNARQSLLHSPLRAQRSQRNQDYDDHALGDMYRRHHSNNMLNENGDAKVSSSAAANVRGKRLMKKEMAAAATSFASAAVASLGKKEKSSTNSTAAAAAAARRRAKTAPESVSTANMPVLLLPTSDVASESRHEANNGYNGPLSSAQHERSMSTLISSANANGERRLSLSPSTLVATNGTLHPNNHAHPLATPVTSNPIYWSTEQVCSYLSECKFDASLIHLIEEHVS